MIRRHPPRKHVASTGIRVAPVKPRNVEKLAGIVHAHGCNVCSKRYCDSCRTPAVNDRCRDCSGAMYGRSTWDLGGDPEDCCRRHCVPASAEDMEVHRCAGDSPWWLCRQCHRTHPYDPTTRSSK